MNDLRFAFRQLLKNPGFTAVAGLTLAVGMGAITAIFTIVNGVLLQPPPYSRPVELALVSLAKSDGGTSSASWSGAQFAEWDGQTESFTALAAYHWTFNFLVHPDGNESLEGLGCSASLFRVLGLEAAQGRTFTDDEKSVRENPVVVISHGLWQRRFNSDPTVIGKVIRLGRLPPVTVVGVMPAGIRFLPSRTNAQEPNYNLHALVDFWMPASPNPTDRSSRFWDVVGRLKPGGTIQQAQAEMAARVARQAQSDPELAGITATVTSLEEILNGEIRRILMPLSGAVGFVLLIAAVNVASLLLVRGLSRHRELAVRSALGAAWIRLVRLALSRVSALPGVRSAAFVWGLPLTGNKWTSDLEIEGRPVSQQLKDQISVPVRSVSADYFALMGIVLKDGRNFTDQEGTNGVAIINETMAHLHFPNENPIGKRIKPMSQIRSDSMAQRQFAMMLIGLFSAVALGLSLIGIYGVMSHSVLHRRHEIGVRMALGAQRAQVLRWMLRRGMSPVMAGLAVGSIAALALTRVIRSLLFGIGPGDPLTYAVIPLLLAAVALLACYLPARRAAKVDPMVALRYE